MSRRSSRSLMSPARTSMRLAGLLTLAAVVAGCARTGSTTPKEIQRIRSGSVEVVLLSTHDALRRGRDAFTVEFRSATGGELLDVGTVRGSATMPMPGSSPMFGTIDVTRTDTPGRYAATSQFDMAGLWRATLEWEGPAGKGTVTFPGPVQ